MITDIIIVFAIICFAVLGFSRGLVKSAASLVKVSASVIIAFILARPLATVLNKIFKLSKFLAKVFGTDSNTGWLILVAISAIIIFIAIRSVLHWFVKFAEKSREKSQVFNKIDRWLGALFGILRFAFLFSLLAIVFYIVTRLPFLKYLHDTVFSGSTIAVWLYDLVIDVILAEIIAAAASAVGR